jgi:hypothetical protein
MSRNRVKAALAFFLAVFLILQLFFPRVEGFDETLYGAKKNKKKGEKCQFDAECGTDICLHYDSSEGPRFTCS